MSGLEAADRRMAFQNWVTSVRDPANSAAEGFRKIETRDGAAIAGYEIAPLPDGRWAVRLRCEFNCGDYSGVGVPWTDFSTRDECVEFFLRTARHHFSSAAADDTSLQEQVQGEMKRLLAPGLFGFLEPIPSREYEEQPVVDAEGVTGKPEPETSE